MTREQALVSYWVVIASMHYERLLSCTTDAEAITTRNELHPGRDVMRQVVRITWRTLE